MSAKNILMTAAGAASGPVNYIEDFFSTYIYTGNGSMQTINNGIDLSNVYNEAMFTTPGTYSWTAPAGVTSVSVVAVGGGGAGSTTNGGGDVPYPTGGSGGGGGLGWKNNIAVTPGNTYTVVVGAGGVAGWWSSTPSGTAGGDSYFINATTVKGGGGGAGLVGGSASGAGGTGGSFVGDGGGNGGNGTTGAYSGATYPGGGGAGGYTGNGGSAVTGNAGLSGSGGGGGAASSLSDYTNTMGAQGGGVGIFGEGPSGAGGTGTSEATKGGRGGSGGTNGSLTAGGGGAVFGGGGGGTYTTNPLAGGGGGAVRIIWGAGRAFPSTNTFQYTTTNGGLVWTKNRSAGNWHYLWDTARGDTKRLSTNSTDAQGTSSGVFKFNNNGFSDGLITSTSANLVSWSFRKAPKFFDVVTYTGDGTTNRLISHNLAAVPGFVTVKATSTTSNWCVIARTSDATPVYKGGPNFALNLTNAATDTSLVSAMGTTSTIKLNAFDVAGSGVAVNQNGVTYVMYLFAHNAGGFGLTGTDNVISCGSFTGPGGTGSVYTNLGWEPQLLLLKPVSTTGNWQIVDNMRGLGSSYDIQKNLYPNTSAAEDSNITSQAVLIDATGFRYGPPSGSVQYIYIAIRRGPMKVPTDATKVFSPNISSGATGTTITTNFPVDMQIATMRTGYGKVVIDRLRGTVTTPTNGDARIIYTNTNDLENSSAFARAWDNTGFQMPFNLESNSDVFLNFRRAPGFFDAVCFTGTGTKPTLTHNLKVVPELIINKFRTGPTTLASFVYQPGTSTSAGALNATDAFFAISDLPATDSTYTPLSYVSGYSYISYLFASCPGVSKVGTYVGTGTTKQINCGFTAGARFVLIRRTDSTGAWYFWDSARGITTGNDPYLVLNSTAAEVTTTDYIDPYSAGFEISSTAPAEINASGGNYIYLAIA